MVNVATKEYVDAHSGGIHVVEIDATGGLTTGSLTDQQCADLKNADAVIWLKNNASSHSMFVRYGYYADVDSTFYTLNFPMNPPGNPVGFKIDIDFSAKTWTKKEYTIGGGGGGGSSFDVATGVYANQVDAVTSETDVELDILDEDAIPDGYFIVSGTISGSISVDNSSGSRQTSGAPNIQFCYRNIWEQPFVIPAGGSYNGTFSMNFTIMISKGEFQSIKKMTIDPGNRSFSSMSAITLSAHIYKL